MIRDARIVDAPAIARIYEHYVRETTVTFEESPVPASDIAARMRRVMAAELPWLVLEDERGIVGYSYAGRFHERSAYRFSVETTIYLDAERTGRGHGTALYAALLERLRSAGLHAAIGLVTAPNPASEALHAKLGFVQVGRLAEVGFKQGRWIDVGYWQKRL